MSVESIPNGERTIESIKDEITQVLALQEKEFTLLNDSETELEFQILHSNGTALYGNELSEMAEFLEKRCFTIRTDEIDLVEKIDQQVVADQNMASSIFYLKLSLDKTKKTK